MGQWHAPSIASDSKSISVESSANCQTTFQVFLKGPPLSSRPLWTCGTLHIHWYVTLSTACKVRRGRFNMDYQAQPKKLEFKGSFSKIGCIISNNPVLSFLKAPNVKHTILIYSWQYSRDKKTHCSFTSIGRILKRRNQSSLKMSSESQCNWFLSPVGGAVAARIVLLFQFLYSTYCSLLFKCLL